MGLGDIHGRARVSPRQPRAFAVCDYCGEWWQRVQLINQYEWYGDVLQDTGFRACPRCVSLPQPQLKPVILPPDPVPIVDPRIEVYSIPADQAVNHTAASQASARINNSGFQQFIGPQGTSLNNAWPTELDPTNPFSSAAQLLASSQTGWGLPQPASLSSASNTIVTSGVAQLLAPAVATRTYLLVYSPSQTPLALAQGQPIWGTPSTVVIGTGQGVLQNANTTPAGEIWTGAVYIQSFIAGTPYYAFWG